MTRNVKPFCNRWDSIFDFAVNVWLYIFEMWLWDLPINPQKQVWGQALVLGKESGAELTFHQRCLVGLRSGLCVGHSSFYTLTVEHHGFMVFALSVLSCWNTFVLGPLVPVKGYFNVTAYKQILYFFVFPTLWQHFGEGSYITVMVRCVQTCDHIDNVIIAKITVS